MKHLIIGVSGQIGQALHSALYSKKETVVGTFNSLKVDEIISKFPNGSFNRLDISNSKQVHSVIDKASPDVIWICGAHTHVDECTDYPHVTQNVNVLGPINVVDACNKIKRRKPTRIVFISSDYVFNGVDGPYSETDIPDPISEYGKQKLLAEHAVATRYANSIIIRTSWVFGPDFKRKNFALRLIDNLRQGKDALIPEDEFSNPTYSVDFAQASCKLLDYLDYNCSDKIWNIVGPTYCSKFEWAKSIARVFDCDQELISGISSKELKRSALRPEKSGLITEKIQSIYNSLNLTDALKDLKTKLR